MDKNKKSKSNTSYYDIGGTRYEVETSFSDGETLNNKIIRLMLSERIKSKGADKSNKGRYNSNIHSVLSGNKRLTIKSQEEK